MLQVSARGFYEVLLCRCVPAIMGFPWITVSDTRRMGFRGGVWFGGSSVGNPLRSAHIYFYGIYSRFLTWGFN